MAILVGNNLPVVQRLAIPAVCLLIAFLAYTSQWLYATAAQLSPGPLTRRETYVFNTLLACLWITYFRACTVDPGRYTFPPPKKTDSPAKLPTTTSADGRKRHCTKCAAPKPPRAHHCKACRRCIPRMDHHCPWTGNCVSLQTFPHFLRFLVFTNVSLWTHLYFVWRRFYGLYELRNMPAYLGPTLPQMAFLTVHAFVGGVTSLALGILLITTVRGWLFNTTMIEGWEIERHEAVLERRYASSGGDDDGWWRSGERAPGGDTAAAHLAVDPVEFPYDIGIFENMAQAMGTRNVLMWFFPLAGGPRVAPYPESGGAKEAAAAIDTTGWDYAENDMNEARGMWPPPDPERIRHAKVWKRRDLAQELEEQRRYDAAELTPEQRKEAFRRRQERDYQRWAGRTAAAAAAGPQRTGTADDGEELTRSAILGELEELPVRGGGSRGPGLTSTRVVVDEGKSGWVNADGEHLGDYGVDEDAEFDDFHDDGDDDDESPASYEDREDAGGYVADEHDAAVLVLSTGEVSQGDFEDEDMPLAELVKRRKAGNAPSSLDT
ncbi:DHHC palmitoyltransferase-domain-containing protein [Microdochium trichocladiopsis]|uniref:Palmitoyltransferase PFA4 n=1 Tax=Microdochium trichocladiopsis TaxID=1682393 RepID=A0A9P8Y3G2_9PEZI|nr:DHHC palmitoyltransferase-domain-containing protein [Microdochium trichocladiopsis]KAH7027794.1 DHHC palmitoyltransferase-domain-containing protein [Microdochium trichocladiopsis]